MTQSSHSEDAIFALITRRENAERLLFSRKEKATERQKSAVREVLQEFFGKTPSTDDDEGLMQLFRQYSDAVLDDLNTLDNNYEHQPRYPGRSVVTDVKALLRNVQTLTYAPEFYSFVDRNRDQFLDAAENLMPVRHFFEGEQKNIFDRALMWMGYYDASRNYLADDELRRRVEGTAEEDMPAGQIQIIGWLYQYYNTEPKDRVFANLKKNIKIEAKDIPAATQLFTPDWIVRYMVENSLGRLWIEGHPNPELRSTWRYYIDDAEQEPEVRSKLDALCREEAKLRPQDILCIDPCCGSGHIVVYMFDVLMRIYESQGWTHPDAVRSIIENSLYALDIDDRAAQLAYFAVMMKAREYDRRFLTRGLSGKREVESGKWNSDTALESTNPQTNSKLPTSTLPTAIQLITNH